MLCLQLYKDKLCVRDRKNGTWGVQSLSAMIAYRMGKASSLWKHWRQDRMSDPQRDWTALILPTASVTVPGTV